MIAPGACLHNYDWTNLRKNPEDFFARPHFVNVHITRHSDAVSASNRRFRLSICTLSGGHGDSLCDHAVGTGWLPSRRRPVPLASFSGAVGFHDARGFPTPLAWKRIYEELAKRRFGFHAQKLLQESALDGNFLQGPREQSVELETGRIGRAIASNISLLIDGQPVAGEGNGCGSVRVGKVLNADEDRVPFRVCFCAIRAYANNLQRSRARRRND